MVTCGTITYAQLQSILEQFPQALLLFSDPAETNVFHILVIQCGVPVLLWKSNLSGFTLTVTTFTGDFPAALGGISNVT